MRLSRPGRLRRLPPNVTVKISPLFVPERISCAGYSVECFDVPVRFGSHDDVVAAIASPVHAADASAGRVACGSSVFVAETEHVTQFVGRLRILPGPA